MLLDVVACCYAKFKTGQTFQPKTPNISFVLWSPKRSATMLDPFEQFFQHCRGPRTLITHLLQRPMGCILPTMHCRSQTCWELLHLFAHHCQHVRNNSQHCWRNNVGSCSARLYAAWNTIVHKNTLTFLCCQNENVHLLAHLQLVIHVVQNPGSKTAILESKGCIRTRKTRSSHHLKWNSLLFVFSQFILCSSILMDIRERWNHKLLKQRALCFRGYYIWRVETMFEKYVEPLDPN